MISPSRRWLGMLMLAPLAGAGETLARPDIPDPFGLGERLALVDYLTGHDHLQPPPDATYDQLVAMYWQVPGRRAQVADHDDAALTRDRIQRLRAELQDRYGVAAPPDADEPALHRLLEGARTRRIAEATERSARAQQAFDRDGASASDLGNIQARIGRAGADIVRLQERIDGIDRERARLIEQARVVVQRKNEQDGVIAGAVAERTRWQKAAEAENRGGMVSKGTRDAYERAVKAHGEAIDAANASVDELNRLKAEHERLGVVQEGLKQQIAALDQERSAASGQLIGKRAAAPGGTGGQAQAQGGWEGRLRAAVVLVQVENRGTGTGFFVTRGGLVVTNAHVVGDGTARMMACWDPSTHRNPVVLRAVRVMPGDDLALLRAEVRADDDIPALELAEVYDLSRPLMAAGFPLAGNVSRMLGTSPADIVVSRGALSSIRRQGEQVQWLQHDCRIASGNSGGPLIDQTTGAVIGVNTMVMEPTGAGAHGDGLNFAIPAWKVRDRFGMLFGTR